MLDYRVNTFLEVHRLRSYTKAAEALLITQPAVSQHIRHLESHYGCALFAKTGRGVEPTPAGDMLYQRLLTMKNDERRMIAEARQLSAGLPAQSAPLRLGCTRTISDYVAPRLLSSHLLAHPDAPVTLRSGNTRELMAALEKGSIDLALVEGSFDRNRFGWEVYASEPYVGVAAPAVAAAMRARDVDSAEAVRARDASGALTEATQHTDDCHCGPNPYGDADPTTPSLNTGSDTPGAGRPNSVRDLLGQRLILREVGSGTREILEKHLAAHDLSVADFAGAAEADSIPAIKACAIAGAGITFMYRVAVEHELATGALVDITPADFSIEHDFCLVWQRGSQYDARYRAFCKTWRSDSCGVGAVTGRVTP